MSDPITVTTAVVGGEDALRRFSTCESDLRARLRSALTDAGAGLVSAARAAAPRRSGKLQGSINQKLLETDTRMTETVRPSAFYARFIEYGTVNHGTRRTANFGGKRFRVRRVRELRSGGAYRIRPHPFMGPAMESMRGRIDAAIEAAVSGAVDKANT